MRPCFSPCHAVNRSSMRCRPSSRSLAENRGASLLASPSGDIGPATFSLSRIDSANTQRRPVCASAAADAADAAGILHDRRGPGPDRFERADRHHQRRLLALQQAGGLDGQTRGVREPEVLVEAALEDGSQVRVAVDEAGKQRLAASVVDLGVRIASRGSRRWRQSPRSCRLRPPAPRRPEPCRR